MPGETEADASGSSTGDEPKVGEAGDGQAAWGAVFSLNVVKEQESEAGTSRVDEERKNWSSA